jgi:methionine-rich copper-binding protein CopC/putative copper export protein
LLKKFLILAAALVAAAGVTAAPAAAHPTLVQAAPAPGIAQPAAPSQITLAFNEKPIARGSEIRVKGLETGPVSLHDKSITATFKTRPAPGVYEVTWTVLGSDGHQTAGRFNFGVAGKNGAPPPGAERLSGAGGTGTGTQSADAQNALSVVARWILVVAAALLFGGGLLVTRAAGGAAVDGWRRAAPLALLLALTASTYGVLSAATAGAGDELDFGLVTQTEVGVAALVRFVVLLAGGVIGARFAVGSRARDLAWGGAGALALAATAFDGHVSSAANPALAGAGQVAHTLTAGLWLGAVLGLVVVARSGGAAVEAARRFAPVAIAALAVAVLTGLVAAFREVDKWYFLRWSDYGRAVIIKAALVAVAAAIGAVAYRRAKGASAGADGPRAESSAVAAPSTAARSPRVGAEASAVAAPSTAARSPRVGAESSAVAAPSTAARSPRAMRAEVAAVLAIAGIASLLAAIPQGRGQQLPALRGNLLPGPAFATILGPGGVPADVTLAPARKGANRIMVAAPDADSASVKLSCSCSKRSVTATLDRTGDTWSADVDLPEDGTWFAYVSLDGNEPASPAALVVGVPEAPGAPPVEVLAVADLSGPDAARCRDFLIGLQLGIGRLNLLGGLDGNHKVALLARDVGADPDAARAAVRGERPVALAGACGPAAGAAVEEAAERGIPSLVGDPSVPATKVSDAYRGAGDPAADGFSAARYVATSVSAQANTGVKTVRVFAADDELGTRWVAGWRAGLEGSGLELDVRTPEELLDADRSQVRDLFDRRKVLALGVDGPASLAPAIALAGGPDNVGYAPSPVVASGRTLTERFVLAAGRPGRLGVVRGMVEIATDSRDALAYSQTVRRVFPGVAPSLQGIRGYVTGLALADGVKRGVEPADLRARLARPAPFTDALASPWRSDATSLGSQRFTLLGATFLSSTLIPPSKGGQSFTGTYFPDGAWNRLSSEIYGPPLDQPPLEG